MEVGRISHILLQMIPFGLLRVNIKDVANQ
jgi:hypothetical protein